MRIGEVEQQTGLPRKTIRFYESKGLLSVERSENSYREYDEAMVKRLKTIAIFRRAGISIADIQLWCDNVISTEEMLKKRLHELKDSVDTASDQLMLCRSLMSGGDMDKFFDSLGALSEDDAAENSEKYGEKEPALLGIDIGTTTISAVILTTETHRLIGVYTVASCADLPQDEVFTKTQDAEGIMERVRRLIESLLHRCPTIKAIGFTGQMHGIVYMDKDGRLLSPLYTWEDNRAGAVYGDVDMTSCEWIQDKSGYRVPPGYGLATHIDLLRHGRVPKNAAKIATVMDYAVCSLTGRKAPLCHTTNAASLGFFSPERGFDICALEKLGVDAWVLPDYTAENVIVGTYEGIPVSVAIGDNQASFLGSVQCPAETALINFGTGSQITILAGSTAEFTPTPEIEIRPYINHGSLISGSALCGGRAYALLESFFRKYIAACGFTDSEQYEIMNSLALDAIKKDRHLHVCTTFCGIRSDHTIRGSVTGIGEENLGPGELIAGVLYGMAEELHGMFAEMPKDGIRQLVVSGNAVRKNPALRRVLERVFGMKILVPVHQEEAAYGSALFAGLTSDGTISNEKFKDFYKYTTETEE